MQPAENRSHSFGAEEFFCENSPLVKPDVSGVSGLGRIPNDLSIDLFAAPGRQAQSTMEKDRIIVVKTIGGKLMLAGIIVSQAGHRRVIIAFVEIIGAEKIVLQPG